MSWTHSRVLCDDVREDVELSRALPLSIYMHDLHVWCPRACHGERWQARHSKLRFDRCSIVKFSGTLTIHLSDGRFRSNRALLESVRSKVVPTSEHSARKEPEPEDAKVALHQEEAWHPSGTQR